MFGFIIWFMKFGIFLFFIGFIVCSVTFSLFDFFSKLDEKNDKK